MENKHYPYVTKLDILYPHHRTRAPQRTVMLMVGTSAIVPTGD